MANKAKVTESKADRFTRLAVPRTQKAIKSLDLVQNLAGPSYECTDVQKAQIKTALRNKLQEVFDALDGVKEAAGVFAFDSDNGEAVEE